MVEFVLKEMDSIYLTDTRSYGPREKQRVPRLPSEYASKQVWVGASSQARFEAEDAITRNYWDRVIWGSDYPHFEGTYQYDATGPNGEPMTWASLRFTYAGLPADRVRAMLGGNAMNAYDLDHAALEKVAARNQCAELRRSELCGGQQPPRRRRAPSVPNLRILELAPPCR